MRYCNKGDIMQYLEERNGANVDVTKCECGFSSHVAKGLQSHQLTCELIKRRLGMKKISKMATNTKIRMWIDTQWFTGRIMKHT